LNINDLRTSDPHLALLGLPGSGKSTALALIGLVAVGEVETHMLDVMSDEVFEDETKNLPPDEKAKQVKLRKEMQDRALEQLKNARKREEEQRPSHAAIDFRRLLPILVHLRDVDLRPEAYGVQAAPMPSGDVKQQPKRKTGPFAAKPLDPAEPLVKALQARFGSVTASTLPRLVYDRLTAGTCLLLIDGYDDIPSEQRPEKLLWLRRFMEIYQGNFVVVAGPEVGYDPLVNLGLTPIFLRAWSDGDYVRLIERWTSAWPVIARQGRKEAPPPDDQVLKRVATNNRGRSPLDVTLKIWSAFAADEKEAGRRGWYDFYVRHRLAHPEARPALEKLAAAILDQSGTALTRERIKEVIAASSAGPDGKPNVNADDLVHKVTALNHLIVDWPGGTYGFTHAMLAGFLASETLINATSEVLSTVATKPAWDVAMPFAAAKTAVDAAVTQRLASTPDLLYSGLFSLIPWLQDAPPAAAWKAEVFKRLTAALLAPSQYPFIRERAMAALVCSRDKNVLFILRQALRSTDSMVRRLGCVALGALGDSEAIKDLSPMLTDPDAKVQLAAGLALGAIGTDAALETVVASLLGGEQNLRRAVAEALAAIPGEGQAVLRDAITSKDMMVRHAAVFGLARVRAAWALSLLYRTLLEDEQWYVRNAAEQAFRNADRLDKVGAMRHPEADALNWLKVWAAQKGEGVPGGENARQVLIRVLQEGESTTKVAAAITIANLGHIPALKPLYSALKDRDENVRAAAYEALAAMQARLGEALPVVG
jgi:HEAT repeat protein